MKLSDFSLLKEDENSYHVGHPKGGRLLQIPKKGLSDKAQLLIERLKKKGGMDQGGSVPGGRGSPSVDKKSASDLEKGASETKPEGFSYWENLKQGLSGKADGGEIEDEPPSPATVPPVQSESVQDSPDSIVADAAAQAPEPTMAQAELSNNVAPANPSPNLAGGAPPSSQTGQFPNNDESFNQEKRSVEEGLKAQQKAGDETSKAFGTAAKAIEDLPTQDAVLQSHNQKDQALQNAFANKEIDPNRYLGNMGTGSKISTGIAMILGGIGGALTHQENPAVKFINNAIANDIESQKNDQSKAMNLWKMNRDATGDDLQANLATQNQLLSAAKVKAQAAAAAAQGPEAKARAAQLVQGIDAQINQGNWMRSRLSNQAAPGTEQQHVADMETMRMLNPKLRDEMEKKYIPGVGVAKVPPSEDQRKELTSYDSLGKRLQEAKNFAQNKDKTGMLGAIPGTSAAGEADNIRNSIAVELNKLYGLNRLTDIEYHNFLEQIPNPGSFFHERAVTKLTDLQKQLDDRKKSVLKGLGVTPFQTSGSDQQAIAWARSHPNDPAAAAVLKAAGTP
jgi:hypothetical protein